jgi:four helix bundle protein
MTYKFQELRVYKLPLEYVDAVYKLGTNLPESERFNLQLQMDRAASSMVLNIAEGSTGQTDPEQNRFLGLALRSCLETVACLDLIERRGYISGQLISPVRQAGHKLFVKLQAFRRVLKAPVSGLRTLNSGRPSSISARRYP